MAQVIKFGCPACGSILQIPLTGSGQQGPCPKCHQPIMAPDLATGAQACRLAAAVPAPAPAPPEPVVPAVIPILTPEPVVPRLEPEEPPAPRLAQTPFAEPEMAQERPAPPAEPIIVQPTPEPIAAPPEEPQPREEPTAPVAPPSKAGLATSLVIGTIASVIAFAGGYQAGQQRPAPAPIAKAAIVPPLAAQPKPEEARKPDEEKQEIKPVQPPMTIAAAKASLEAFLAAKDWKSRLPHALSPDRTTSRMEAYYASHPDGATPPVRISIEHCEADEASELMLVIFRVCTAEAYEGYPVAVAETKDGWKVDWESFIEFRDELFQEFVAGKGKETASFHLIIRPSSEPSPIKNQVPYEVTAPVTGKAQQAFVPMGTDLANKLAKLTSGAPFATLVLELTRRPAPEGGTRIEILSIAASDWRPGRN